MEKPKRRLKKGVVKIAYGMLAVVSLAVFLYSGYSLLSYYMDHRKEVALEKGLAQLRGESVGEEIFTEVGADVTGTDLTDALQTKRTPAQIREFYSLMKARNDDYVGWITLKGNVIDYPVVQRDNSYYLNHDFEGKENRHGSIFLDENCSVGDSALLIHGHHMKDGTMFGELRRFKDAEYRKGHREVFLEFADEIFEYRIFAAALVDLTDPNSFRFEELPATENETSIYMEELRGASFWFDETAINKEDSILVLSTCDYGTEDERLIVVAKKR